MANAPVDPKEAHAAAIADVKRLMRLARPGPLATLEVTGGPPLTPLLTRPAPGGRHGAGRGGRRAPRGGDRAGRPRARAARGPQGFPPGSRSRGLAGDRAGRRGPRPRSRRPRRPRPIRDAGAGPGGLAGPAQTRARGQLAGAPIRSAQSAKVNANKSKEIQGNPSKKACISLDSFGGIGTFQWVT